MSTTELQLSELRRAELDQALAALRQNQRRWAQLPPLDRASLLDELLRAIHAAARCMGPEQPRGKRSGSKHASCR